MIITFAILNKGYVYVFWQRGWTPLIMAAKGGYSEVVDSLLSRDPNVNATDQVIDAARFDQTLSKKVYCVNLL